MRFAPTHRTATRTGEYNKSASYRIEVPPRTPLIQTVRSLAAQGGGVIYLGPYTYTITGTLNLLTGVSIIGIPGLTKIRLATPPKPEDVVQRSADIFTTNRTRPSAAGMGPVVRVFTGARLIDCEVELVREGGITFTRDEGDGFARVIGTGAVSTIAGLQTGDPVGIASTNTADGTEATVTAAVGELFLSKQLPDPDLATWAAGGASDQLTYIITTGGSAATAVVDCNGQGGTVGAWATFLNANLPNLTVTATTYDGDPALKIVTDFAGTGNSFIFTASGGNTFTTTIGWNAAIHGLEAGTGNVAHLPSVTFAEVKAIIEAATTDVEVIQGSSSEVIIRDTSGSGPSSTLVVSHNPNRLFAGMKLSEDVNGVTARGGGWGNCIVHCCEPFFQDRALDSGTGGDYQEDNGWQGTKYGPATVSGCVLNTKVSKTRGIFVSRYGVAASEGSPDSRLSDGFMNVNITNNTIIPMNAGEELEQACIYFAPGSYYGVCLGNICTAGDSAGTLGHIVYPTSANSIAFGGEATSNTFVRTSSNCAKYSEY
jgi:hypothetical protein